MKERKVKKLLRLVWIFAILTMVLLPTFVPVVELSDPQSIVNTLLVGLYTIGIFIFGLLSVAFLIAVSSRLSQKQKKPFILILIVSGIMAIVSLAFFEDIENEIFYLAIGAGTVGISILSLIYVFTCYLNYFNNIFLGLFAGILIGLILNRFGIEVGGFVVGFCFFLSFYGFLYFAFKYAKKSKENNQFRRLISVFCYVNCCIFLLLFFKFSSSQPAFTKSLDAIGVIIFLIATIALFISMPFSNFIEWIRVQRFTFYKVILLPFVFFLIVFSLRYLLPDSTYRKIFFVEYSRTEKVHFNMKDYASEFD